jgi:hypothetical protein
LLTIFHYEGNYDEPFMLAKQNGVKPFDLVVHMQKLLARAPAAFTKVIDEFLRESQEEIFPTREACMKWAHAHYAELVDGTAGGNLLSKYSMLGRFFATQASLDFLQLAIADVLDQKNGSHDAEQLATTVDYLRAVMLHVPFAKTAAERTQWTSRFDVEAWAHDNYAKPLASYAFDVAQTFSAEVEPDKKALILTKVGTFGEHASGLGKFTRTMFARDLRRTFARERAGAVQSA